MAKPCRNQATQRCKGVISDQNCMTRGLITSLLHPFWNRPNTGLGQFKYLIDAVLSWFEIKFIHFWWGGGGAGGNKSFANKSCKICHMILFVFHFPEIWLVTLNKPWNLIGCFVFSVACSLVGKKMRFKAKKRCDSWINRSIFWSRRKNQQNDVLNLLGRTATPTLEVWMESCPD